MTQEETPLRTAKLIMVTTNNNNKFYEMKENGDGTFTVSYGRVGGTPTKRTYPVRQWNSKYNEKVRKGYKDQTHLFAVEEEEVKFADIDDAMVEKLVRELMRYANNSISNNYQVTADQVTQKQVDEAQNLLDRLVDKVKAGMDVKEFNRLLLDLYQVIPRKMGNVNDHLVNKTSSDEEIEEIEKMLSEEQATLDVMRGQVKVNDRKKEAAQAEQEQINLLEAMGLTIKQVEDTEVIGTIKDLMQDEANKFHKAYEVINLKTQERFDGFVGAKKNPKVELFWHGSRNENWMSILETGLVLRPANAVITGKMFGYGLYFADKFRKSLNYTSLRGSYWTGGRDSQGYIALFNVHVGEQMHIKNHKDWCYQLNEDNLKKRGSKYDSLFAEGGADLRNNEYIVYNQAQCTVKYLIEVRN